MKGSEEVYINMRPLCPGPNSGEGGGGAERRRRKEIERSREREEEQKRKGREGSRAWRERMRRRGFCSVTQGSPPKCHPLTRGMPRMRLQGSKKGGMTM